MERVSEIRYVKKKQSKDGGIVYLGEEIGAVDLGVLT